MHLRSDSIWRAASSSLNKNLDRCQNVDMVSTPLTWDLDGATGQLCDGHGCILQFLLQELRRRRNCTMALYAWRIAVLVVAVYSRSSFMQPQRAQCFAHASMSRSADRASRSQFAPSSGIAVRQVSLHSKSRCALPAGALDDLGTSHFSIHSFPALHNIIASTLPLIHVAYLVTMAWC